MICSARGRVAALSDAHVPRGAPGLWRAGCAVAMLLLAISAGADRVHDLAAALQSPSVAARADAAEALAKEVQAKGGKAACRPAYGALVGALGDPVESVRKQALRALASLSAKSDVPALVALLRDSDPHRREAAATILGILNNRRASAGLLQAARDRDAAV
ncbi:MAG TPA: HEAT repeat domain-containing protein, partial [Chthonomonadaceae bacterium]|nr:HEAT repeat domain-containing protein [Chthonomonadaceae bacterium]